VKPPPPPIRFLVAVVGCWAGARALILWSERTDGPSPIATATQIAAAAPVSATAPTAPQRPLLAERNALPASAVAGFTPFTRPGPGYAVTRAEGAPLGVPDAAAASLVAQPAARTEIWNMAPAAPPGPYPPLASATSTAPPAALARTGRLSGSAWLFLREEIGGGGLAPGGTLGGSQAGGRLAYRINGDAHRPISLLARLYAPLERPQGAEAALGLDWRPLPNIPVHILAERRQRLGREGRSDFGITVYGGGERRLLRGRLRLEAYGQAGVVGVQERDLFTDGAVRASTPIGAAEIGAGAWGGAQPGAARLDIGPQASIRIPFARIPIRATAEWRFRIAGDARPESGPALTVSTDF